jgi:cytochrome c
MAPQGGPRGRAAILAVDTQRSGRLNGSGAILGRMGRDRHDKRNGEQIMRTLIVAAALIAGSGYSASAQDVAKGEISFHKCLPCHAIGDDAQNKIGPELNGIDGRHSGSVPDFSYSDANKNSGIVWNEAQFKDYIKDPRAKIPGTKMIFAGIKNEQEISDLWAYVSQFNADGSIKKK